MSNTATGTISVMGTYPKDTIHNTRMLQQSHLTGVCKLLSLSLCKHASVCFAEKQYKNFNKNFLCIWWPKQWKLLPATGTYFIGAPELISKKKSTWGKTHTPILCNMDLRIQIKPLKVTWRMNLILGLYYRISSLSYIPAIVGLCRCSLVSTDSASTDTLDPGAPIKNIGEH